MHTQTFSRTEALNNIPKKKLENLIEDINISDLSLKDKSIRIKILNKQFESNIPIEYWDLSMKNFKGFPPLLEQYNEYVKDIKKSYLDGKSICFAGNHGTGKTLTMNSILKVAAFKGYSCLYTSLSDVVSVLTSAPQDEKYAARKELLSVDFLALDEFDNRFFSSENAADLFARTLEGIFRTRANNKLPLLMATNSPNALNAFNGPLKESLKSLMSGYMEVFTVLGEDFRGKL